MLFYSFAFLFCFLPIVLGLFFVVETRLGRRPAIIFLTLASFVFYANWNFQYIFLLVPSIVVNYFLGRRLQAKPSRLLVTFGVLANLGLLGYYKYTNFFLETIDVVVGTSWQIETIVLPIAISFYTFQQVAWLVDSFTRKVDTKTEGFWRYALFVSFFPQLIAGPIVHHSEMMPQFSKDSTFQIRWTSLAVGLSIFIIGLAKKVVIADGMAAIATPVFTDAAGGMVPFYDAWLAAFCYTFQVYFDFSGYSDMAIGLARMFNIRLPVNFNSPLKAGTIVEFWQRWHITMTRFFQAYVHVPLSIIFYRYQMKSGIRGNFSIHITTFITLLAIGFWHGANWTFIVFGLMHGCMVVGHHIWKSWRKKHKIAPVPYVWSVTLTFFLFMLTCVTYRAEDMSVALAMYGSMFAPTKISGTVFANSTIWLPIFCFLTFIVALFLPNTQQLMQRYAPVIDMSAIRKLLPADRFYKLIWRPTPLWFVALFGLYSWSLVSILDASKVQEFIYFQF